MHAVCMAQRKKKCKNTPWAEYIDHFFFIFIFRFLKKLIKIYWFEEVSSEKEKNLRQRYFQMEETFCKLQTEIKRSEKNDIR